MSLQNSVVGKRLRKFRKIKRNLQNFRKIPLPISAVFEAVFAWGRNLFHSFSEGCYVFLKLGGGIQFFLEFGFKFIVKCRSKMPFSPALQSVPKFSITPNKKELNHNKIILIYSSHAVLIGVIFVLENQIKTQF